MNARLGRYSSPPLAAAVRRLFSWSLTFCAACSDDHGTTREPVEEVLVPCRVKFAFAGPLRAEIGDKITLQSRGSDALIYRWSVSPSGRGKFTATGRDAEFVCETTGNAILSLVAVREGLPCSELLHVPITCLDPRVCTTLGDASVVCGEPGLGLDGDAGRWDSGRLGDAATDLRADAGADSGH